MLQGVPTWNKYQNPLSVLNHIYKTISEEFSLHVDDKSISNINNNIKAGCVKKKKLRNVDNNKTFNNSYEDA